MATLEQIARTITSAPAVWIVCAAILIWAVVAYLRLRRRLVPFVKELERYCKLLKGIQGEMAFASRFEELDEKIRKSRLLGHQWSEFRETLIDPAPDDPAPRLYNSHSASAFFSRDNLLGEHVNLRLYNALPNLFTGAGILGTFVGLVAGIYLAGQGLADPDRAQAALSDLLSGASLAFSTSIAGLITSIAFSSREKHWLHQFEKYRQTWVDGLDARLRRVTLEKLASEALTESRRQTTYFSQFAEQLAFQLTEALEKTVPRALDEKVAVPLTAALDELKQAVHDLAQNQQQANENTLREIVERFSRSISGAAGREMEALAGTLSTLGGNMENLISEITRHHDEIRRQSEASVGALAETFRDGASMLQEKLTDSMTGVVEGLASTVDGMSAKLDDWVHRLSGDLENAARALADSTSGLSRATTDIRGILSETAKLGEYIDQLIASSRKTLSSLERVAAGLAETATATETTIQDIRAATEQAHQASTTLQSALDAFAGHQAAMEQVWEQYKNRFDGLDESLARTFQQIEQGLERYTQMANDFITQLDEHTAKIAGTLSGAVQELSQSVEDLSDALERGNQ